jgi:iron complex transport system permease protein
MKITLDIDRLLKEGRITPEEYERLKGFASSETASLALNILVAFGVIAVAGGTLALLHSATLIISLGLALAATGVYLGAAHARQWGMLGTILLLIGSLTAAGGILVLTDGSVAGFLVVTLLYVVASLISKSGLLAALSAFSLLATVGGMTDYSHATYFLAIEQPLITIVLFGLLGLGAYLLSLRVPIDYARLAIIFSRTSLFIVNLGFWIGSLWGDTPGASKADWDYSRKVLIPDWVFAIAWAVALIAVGVWAARMNKRWVVNLVATFGAIHFYTQWFERLGASPATILIAGLVTIGIAVGIFHYNQVVRASLDDQDSAAT